ncbi:hypothetical protein Tsubulata_024003 [Turnera subulata]|uniref:Response regulatory domain-containing protein n=1 Tax=Turnera subulata TaxID=218843 RepID=A0A9Q0FS05_9ROSI|nr:hypothetical protein Tsubulata_024003 [Turnera subulata]
MDSNGFSSPRNEAFNPAGLRVLVVDDDPTWLKILEKMLKKCSYEEPKRTLTVDIPNSRGPTSSHLDFGHSFTSPESEVNFAPYDSAFPRQYLWCGIADVQMKQKHKPLHLDDGLSQIPLPSQQLHIQADCSQPSPSISTGSIKETGVAGVVGPSKPKPLYDEYASNTNHKALEPISTNRSSMESQGVNLTCIKETETAKKNMTWGMSPPEPLEEAFKVRWVPNEYYGMNSGMQSTIECLSPPQPPEYFDPGLIADVAVQLNDPPRFDYEALYDSTEYSVIDQGLFIA